MYKVMYFNPSSPMELQIWLNKCFEDDNWKLIAVDNGYYIFEVQDDVTAENDAA